MTTGDGRGQEGILSGKETTLRRRVALALASGLGALAVLLLLGAPPDTSLVISLAAFALMLKPTWMVVVLVAFVIAAYLALVFLWPFLPDT
ncbi:MAG TPA: hypothetical protein VEY12_09520 [Thermoplasmata archaeon]|nr:hypothetical protein [Thermoplasmata archaeon]